jgi:hypothetical protein
MDSLVSLPEENRSLLPSAYSVLMATKASDV